MPPTTPIADTASWPIPTSRPPAGRSSDLLCAGHRAQIIDTLIWPADLKLGAANTCRDCQTVTSEIPDGLYVSHDRREHNVRLVTAEHESGHAVASLALGYTVTGIYLYDESSDPWIGDAGRVDFIVGETVNLISSATVLWAGPTAHREGLRRRGLLTDANIIGTVESSVEDARDIERCNLASWAATAARRHATALVHEHWADIERLAAVLAEKGTLNEQEILDLVNVRRQA